MELFTPNIKKFEQTETTKRKPYKIPYFQEYIFPYISGKNFLAEISKKNYYIFWKKSFSYSFGNEILPFFSPSFKIERNPPPENLLYFTKWKPLKNFLCFRKT